MVCRGNPMGEMRDSSPFSLNALSPLAWDSIEPRSCLCQAVLWNWKATTQKSPIHHRHPIFASILLHHHFSPYHNFSSCFRSSFASEQQPAAADNKFHCCSRSLVSTKATRRNQQISNRWNYFSLPFHSFCSISTLSTLLYIYIRMYQSNLWIETKSVPFRRICESYESWRRHDKYIIYQRERHFSSCFSPFCSIIRVSPRIFSPPVYSQAIVLISTESDSGQYASFPQISLSIFIHQSVSSLNLLTADDKKNTCRTEQQNHHRKKTSFAAATIQKPRPTDSFNHQPHSMNKAESNRNISSLKAQI